MTSTVDNRNTAEITVSGEVLAGVAGAGAKL